MNGKMRSCVKGLILGTCGKPYPLMDTVVKGVLTSADGYLLMDVNGLYLIPKEAE